jgi:molecular chaperone GrpE
MPTVRNEREEEGSPTVSTERRGEGGEHEGPVIRDRRRIDPSTGAVREQAEAPTSAAPGQAGSGAGSAAGTAAPVGADEVARLNSQLAERTADVQRIHAEYANYRKRVERDRVAVREQALANVLAELVPVLDDIGRARDHGELTGGFKSVAESFESILGKLGLERFGERGDPFDPNVHEALMHSYSNEVAEPTCVEILQPGYSVAGRVLRAARVAVAEPSAEPGARSSADQAQAPGPAPEPAAEAGAPGGSTSGGESGRAHGGAPPTGDPKPGQAGQPRGKHAKPTGRHAKPAPGQEPTV